MKLTSPLFKIDLFKTGSLTAAVRAAGLVTLLLSGAVFAQAESTQTEAPDEPASSLELPLEELPLEELQIFAEIFGKIKSEYVDPADDVTLLRDAIHGMLAGLDPHSAFLDPEEFREMRISTEGKFGGLGPGVTVEDGFITVVTPLDDTPAQQAGIQPGDIIVMLDGVATHGMNLRAAVESMRGPPGSKIVLTLSRPSSGESFELTLVRAVIEVASVKSEMLEDGFGYVRIITFQSATSADLHREMAKLEQQNQRKLKGLVLDLRNNPGGVLHSAVEVSDAFLDAGVIVSTRGRHADADHSFQANPEDVTADAPVVVLVNGGSASAAEIVAGALQDHQRAIIMGTRTFGKGSVQTIIPVNNGGALKLTTARYYTPAERSIQARGIVPDIIVEAGSPTLNQADEWDLKEVDLLGHLENGQTENDQTEATAADAESTSSPAASNLAARDYQVGEALNLLKGMSLVKLRGEHASPASITPASKEG